MKSKMKTIVMLQLFIFAGHVFPLGASEGKLGGVHWPEIRGVKKVIHFDATHQLCEFYIRDTEGVPVYVLDARIPSDNEPSGDYDYSGAFDCRLYLYDKSAMKYSTLLRNRRDATRDWQTDGRFTSEEILAVAAASKTRSIVQKSMLRGMALTITIYNIAICETATGPQIVAFDVSFEFSRDINAQSDIACTEP